MPIYKCDICKKIFELKTDYTRHINKKYKCKETKEIINDYMLVKDENEKYKCIKCDNFFNYKTYFILFLVLCK